MAVAFQTIQPPAAVLLSLKDHHGGFCSCMLQKGQQVLQGQRIGLPQAGGAAVHASVSGTVRAVSAAAVVIENDFRNTPAPDCVPLEDPDGDALTEKVANAGLLTADRQPLLPALPCRFLVLSLLPQNSGEPDPLQLYGIDSIFGGLRLARQLWQPKELVIFWDKRCRSSGVLAKSFGGDALLLPMDSRYPGAEPQVLRKKLWSLGMSRDCLLLDGAGAAGLYEAVWLGQPWIRKTIVLRRDGRAAQVPLGTALDSDSLIVEKTTPTLVESSCNLSSRIVG
jgi:Na+-translocating ferredoxin:NAD+ oxidoreductase RnfC subunit